MENKPRNAFIAWVKQVLSDIKRKLTGNAVTEIDRIEREFLKVAYAVSDQNAQQQSVSERTQNAAVNEKTTTDDGGGVEYSIITDSKNRKIVMLDRNIFDGISDLNARSEALEDWIINKFGGQKYNTADFFFVVVNERTAGKMKFWNENMDEVAYERKLSAAEHIDELIKISKFKSHSNNVKEKHKEFAEKGWNYFDSYLTDGERVYKAEISAAVSKTEQVIYNIGRITDVGKFEENKKNSYSLRGSPNKSVTILENEASNRNSINSLPETPQIVKEKSANQNDTKQKQEADNIRYSLPESDHEGLLRQFEEGKITRKEYLDALKGKQKLLNPVEIANTPKSEASTTPKLDEPKMQGEGDGESNLHGSLDRSAIITDEVKEKIKADTYIKNYGITYKKPVDNYKIKGCFTSVKQPF